MSPAKRTGGDRDRLEPYRKLRKPLPPPSRALPDRRRRFREEAAEREARGAEEAGRRARDPGR